jgi:hypothetical protein
MKRIAGTIAWLVASLGVVWLVLEISVGFWRPTPIPFLLMNGAIVAIALDEDRSKHRKAVYVFVIFLVVCIGVASLLPLPAK